MSQTVEEGIIERFAQISEAYDREYPGRPDNWKPAGVLDMTVGDLRGAATAWRATEARKLAENSGQVFNKQADEKSRAEPAGTLL